MSAQSPNAAQLMSSTVVMSSRKRPSSRNPPKSRSRPAWTVVQWPVLSGGGPPRGDEVCSGTWLQWRVRTSKECRWQSK